MSESMNISFEHKSEQEVGETEPTSPTLMPKTEPSDFDLTATSSPIPVIPSKGYKKKGDESDFDPTGLTEEEDPSIPDEDDASFESYRNTSRGSPGKRGRRGRPAQHRSPSKQFVSLQTRYDSEDDHFAPMPRQRLSRACKSSSKPIMDIDIPSSSSPEEFDEAVHVMTKEYRLQLEAKKALESSSKDGFESVTPDAATVKVEVVQEEMQLGSPSKKVKMEPIEGRIDASDAVDAEHENTEKQDGQN